MQALGLDSSVTLLRWRGTTVRLFPAPPEFYVYQLHFHERLHHAGHYTGATCNLAARLALHRAGRGAKLMKAVIAAGISFEIGRLWKFATWQEARAWERHIKDRHNAIPGCPLCQHKPTDILVQMHQGHWPFALFASPGKRRPMIMYCDPRFVHRLFQSTPG